jgi:c-di-GMP-binding flagellar brake protein YcgR
MSNTDKGFEKRRFKRQKAKFIITYKLDNAVQMHMLIGSREVDALMVDLSEVGIAVLTKYDIPVSTNFLIKFTLINLHAHKEERVKSIEATGKVRYKVLTQDNVYRLGISFTRLSEEDRRAIANFVKKVSG